MTPTSVPKESAQVTFDGKGCPKWIGSIGLPGEVDVFTLDLADGAEVAITSTQHCAVPNVEIVGPSGSQIDAVVTRAGCR